MMAMRRGLFRKWAGSQQKWWASLAALFGHMRLQRPFDVADLFQPYVLKPVRVRCIDVRALNHLERARLHAASRYDRS